MIAPSVPTPRTTTPTSLVGMSLGGGRYSVVEELGAGGMGEVYRARDSRLHRDVAIKRIAPELRDDPAARSRFLKEVRRTSRLDDPHLTVVHDVVEEKGDVFLVLELVPGTTLREGLAQGALPLDDFLSIAIQVVRALVAAHARGIVHGDLKPENVMCTPEGDVKVLDFGLARAMPVRNAPEDPTRTMSAPSPPSENAGAGTAAYMSPEALRGEPTDEKSDLFALGILLYEAWTRVHPFRGPNLYVTTDRILHETPLPASHHRAATPAALDALLTRLLIKESAVRPAGAREVLGALQEIARGRNVAEPSHPAARPPLPWPMLLGFVLAAAVLVVGTQPRVRHAIGVAVGLEKPLPPQKLVAILPFQGVERASQPLADGLTYTLASRLTAASGGFLQVIPLTEVRHANVRSSSEAHEQLGATLVVSGSVQKIGEGARVNFEIVDAVKGVQLRGRTVDVPSNGSIILQDMVAQAMTEELEVELRPEQRAAMQHERRPKGAANALVLEGRGRLLDYQDPASVEDAVRLFRKATLEDARYAPAWAGFGEAAWDSYLLSHRAAWVDTARVALDRAVRLDPSLAEAHVGLGDVHRGTGFPELAVVEYRKAIELDAASDAAYRGIAAAYQALGRDRDAEAAYREAIAKHPDYWAGYSHLGAFYLREARYAEGYAMFKRVTEIVPLNARGWSNLGGTLSYLDRNDEAIAALREAARLRPSAVVESNLGSLLYYANRGEDAVRHFRRALELAPNDYRMHGKLAECLRHAPEGADSARTHYALAIRGAESALEINPRDASALASLASYDASLGRAAEARRSILRALEIAPDDPEIRFYAVLVYEELGERTTALDHLRRTLDAGYSLVEVRRNPDLVELRKDPRTVRLLANRG